MAGKLTRIAIKGKRGTRGKRMTTGQGWRLVKVRGNKQFVGSLLKIKIWDRTGAQFLASASSHITLSRHNQTETQPIIHNTENRCVNCHDGGPKRKLNSRRC